MSSKIRRFAAGFTAAAVAFVSIFASAQSTSIFGLGTNMLSADAAEAVDTTPKRPTSGTGTEGDPFQISTAGELYWFAGWVNGTLQKSEQEEFEKEHPTGTTTTTPAGDAPSSSDGPSIEESTTTSSAPSPEPGDSTIVPEEEESTTTAAPSGDSTVSGEQAAPAPVLAEPMSEDTGSTTAEDTSAPEEVTTTADTTASETSATTAATTAPAEEKCDKHPNACAKLTGNIDLGASNEKPWKPIGGSSSNAYTGTFDGDGHTVSGLNISDNSGRDAYGFIMYNGGTVKNLTVKGNISLGWFIGLVVGDNKKDGKVINCHADGEVGASYSGGGLVGYNDGTIEKSTANVKLESGSSVGVLAGNNSANGDIKDCIATGGVVRNSGTNGGITSYNSGKITNCVYIDDGTGIYSGRNAIASSNSGTITNCYYYSSTVNGGIGNRDVEGQAEHVDPSKTPKGEITWRLQNYHNTSEHGEELVWVQDLNGEDTNNGYPCLICDCKKPVDETNRVYRVKFLYPTKEDVYSVEYVNKDMTIKSVSDPTAEHAGYTFSGWYEDEDCTNNKVEKIPETTEKDLLYYGKGEKTEFNITYELDGGTLKDGESNPATYDVETPDITLKNPSKTGYVFEGWSGTGIPVNEYRTEVVIPKGSTGERKYTAHFADKDLPSGTITLGKHTWKEFIEPGSVNFNLSFNTDMVATIEGYDTADDNLTIQYHLSTKALSKEQLEKQSWLDYPAGGIHISNGAHVIYAKISDHSGNSIVISSQGFYMDSDAPVIEGVEDGRYCGPHKITVKDDNISTVTVNGEKVDLDESNSFTITMRMGGLLPFKTIVAKDKSGSTTTVRISVYNAHSGIPTEQDKIPASCVDSGSVTVVMNCRYCGTEMSKTQKTLEPTGHMFGSWEEIDAKTCAGDSGQKRVCTVCGFTETKYTNPDGHNWEKEPRIDKAPTCTEDGSKSIHCTDCEATQNSEVIHALGHTEGAAVHENEIAATCIADGSYNEVVKCTVCGATISTKSVTVTATGHKPDAMVKEHVVEPTCDKQGQHDEVVYCTVCRTEISRKSGVTDPAKGHTFGDWYDVNSATCEGEGGQERKCETCGYTEQKDVSATGHSWSDEYIVDKEPTCTEEGSESKHCTKCDAKTDSRTINPKGHVNGEQKKINEVQPTCTAEGSYDLVVECTVCGKEVTRTTVTTQMIPHNIVTESTETPASCDTAGTLTVVNRCTVCNKTISTNVTEIPATGHKFCDWHVTESSTCLGEGGEARTCEVCGYTETRGLTAAGHVWETEQTIDVFPTCTTEGSKSYHCEVCDARGASESIPPLGHSAAAAVKENVVSENCTEAGSYDDVVYCSVCGEKLVTTHFEVAARGHIFGEWEKFTSDACVGDGGERRSCKVCGLIETKNVEDNGHDWESEPRTDKEPTCTEEGSKSIHCADCDATMNSEVIPATGHTPAEAVKEKIVDATCTAEGSYDEVVYCSVCKAEISRTTVKTEKIAHVPGDPVTENLKEADCDTPGSYDEVIYCKTCGTRLQLTTKEIPETGHTFGEWVSTDSPTCEGEGGESRTCTVCGYIESKGVSAAGHVWDSDYTIDKQPDCTNEGSRSIHCSKCDAVKDSETIPSLGHTSGAPVHENVVAATCTSNGSYEAVTYCEVCKAEIQRVPVVTELAAHTPGEVQKINEVKPTCDKAGSYEEVILCTVCGTEIKHEHITVEALGHKYGEWTEITSECSGEHETGRTHSCTVCGHIETEGVSMSGHVWDDEYTLDKAPTCEEEGSRSIRCLKCGLVKESVLLDALGHTPGEAVKEDIVDPTCTAEGSYDEVVYCTVCKKELSRTTVTLPAAGHDIDEKWDSDANGHWHSCKACEQKFDEQAHSFGTWITETAAGAESEGSRYKECEICGYKLYETVPPTGGSVIAEVEKGEGTPDISMPNDTVSQLEDELITDEDRQLVEQGAEIDIVLQVENIDDAVSAEDKQETEGCAAELDYTVGRYLDIELMKIISGVDGTDIIGINQLKKPVLITIAIPDDLKADGRDYAVIRIHDGVAELLEDTDDDPDTLTIATDKFSTYAIVYKDAPSEDEPTTPPADEPTTPPADEPTTPPADEPTDDEPDTPSENPGTGVPLSGAAGMLAAAVAAIALITRRKK